MNDMRNILLQTLATQNIRHRIFHYAPKLLAISSGKDMLESFLNFASLNNLTFNWTLHLHLLNWLSQHEKWHALLTTEIKKELLIASVTRWSLTGLDHVDAKGIMVTSKQLPLIAAQLWKSESAGLAHKVMLLQLAEKIYPHADSYALSTVYGSWEKIAWQPVPK